MRLTKTLRAMTRAATLGVTAVLISGAAHATDDKEVAPKFQRVPR